MALIHTSTYEPAIAFKSKHFNTIYTKEQAVGVLEIANKIVNSGQLDKIYETIN